MPMAVQFNRALWSAMFRSDTFRETHVSSIVRIFLDNIKVGLLPFLARFRYLLPLIYLYLMASDQVTRRYVSVTTTKEL